MTAPRCADVSAAVGEELAGSAPHVESWLLLEVREPWPRDVAAALGDGTAGVRAVRAWLDATPASRLLFVRRPGKAGSSRRVFVVRATATDAEVRRLELADLGKLDGLELDEAGERVETGLVLVCGHGSRDACCALRGTAVFTALADHVPPDELWLSSHQGGHRFAANVIVLPAGIQLGRVDPSAAAQVVGAARDGTLSLEHFRGRTCYPARAQTADIAVRKALALRDLADLEVLGDDGRVVELRGADGTIHRVTVEATSGPPVPASCGADPEPQPAFRAVSV